ncbi:MAG: hypothetical protein KGK07_05615 [Chloroflexota bacterium]|nr:hypothetical protein [Chloroflexota bacterium]
MLDMKKNTGAKVGTVVASIATLATVFGLVQRNPPPASVAQPATPAVISNSVQSAPSSPLAQAAQQTQAAPLVQTRTHVS